MGADIVDGSEVSLSDITLLIQKAYERGFDGDHI
jgi:hypothetical protein